MEKEKGSVMILTMVAVLVLSLMLTGLLTVGTTEIFTTQNYHLKKVAYYTAAEGIEWVRSEMQATEDPQQVQNIIFSLADTEKYSDEGLKLTYMTGTLLDLENGETKSPKQLEGFPTPNVTGRSLSADGGVKYIVWKLCITAKVNADEREKKVAYAELIAGVLTSTVVGYSDF